MLLEFINYIEKDNKLFKPYARMGDIINKKFEDLQENDATILNIK